MSVVCAILDLGGQGWQCALQHPTSSKNASQRCQQIRCWQHPQCGSATRWEALRSEAHHKTIDARLIRRSFIPYITEISLLNLLLVPCSLALIYSRTYIAILTYQAAPFLSLCVELVIRHVSPTELSSKMWISFLWLPCYRVWPPPALPVLQIS